MLQHNNLAYFSMKHPHSEYLTTETLKFWIFQPLLSVQKWPLFITKLQNNRTDVKHLGLLNLNVTTFMHLTRHLRDNRVNWLYFGDYWNVCGTFPLFTPTHHDSSVYAPIWRVGCTTVYFFYCVQWASADHTRIQRASHFWGGKCRTRDEWIIMSIGCRYICEW